MHTDDDDDDDDDDNGGMEFKQKNQSIANFFFYLFTMITIAFLH